MMERTLPILCIKRMEERVLKCLSDVEKGYGLRKFAIERDTKIPMDILTVILKRLKDKGEIELMRIFSEETLLVNGSGYWLKSKNK